MAKKVKAKKKAKTSCITLPFTEDILRQAVAEAGRRNAKKRARVLTPARRSAIAKKAALARWGKKSAGGAA